jgi:putative transposon-encoded protein
VDQEKWEKHDREAVLEITKGSVKFEVYGEEIIEKKVRKSGNSGRIYLPPNWVGHSVKIVRID